MNVGDSIGILRQAEARDGTKRWEFAEAKIKKIAASNKRIRVFTDSLARIPINDVIDNTNIMEYWMRNGSELVLTDSWVLLSPAIRARFAEWVKWANENPQKVDIAP